MFRRSVPPLASLGLLARPLLALFLWGPVRTLRHPTGIPHTTPGQACELAESSKLHERSRYLLSLVATRGGLIWQAALAPFLGDLRHFLQVKDEATWESLLTVQDGQPFRLNLWHCLAESLALFDPHLPRPGLRLFPTTS